MFIDLNVPIPAWSAKPGQSSQKPQKKDKGKGKQQAASPQSVAYSPAQVTAFEARIDLLVHLGYTVFALNQVVQRKVDPKTHVNALDPLLDQLRKRQGVVYLKRLTIVLDEESEKGFGLTTALSSLFAPYDLLALAPTTDATFSLACLTHTLPSPLTAHILSLPLTLPRLPFRLKHTLVRTALKNGAVFELNYAGALGGAGADGDGAEGGAGAKRNWWAGAREVVRVTKGKGILVSGGAAAEAECRAPRDVANLVTILGLSQNVAHDGSTKVPQSLILRAQTRKTYRAVLSEPRVVIPSTSAAPQGEAPSLPSLTDPVATDTPATVATIPAHADGDTAETGSAERNGKKRPREDGESALVADAGNVEKEGDAAGRKKKKKKTKEANA